MTSLHLLLVSIFFGSGQKINPICFVNPLRKSQPFIKKFRGLHQKIPTIKEELHQKYKNYRNIISTRNIVSTLMKKSKQNYFTKYFESNIENLKNTWKGIKSIISLKHSASRSPNLLNFNNVLTSDSLEIANMFNNYFSSVGEKTQSKMSFSNKNYTNYLHGENFNSFFHYTYRQRRSYFHHILTQW